MNPPTPRYRTRHALGALALLVAGLLVAGGLATSCTKTNASADTAKEGQPAKEGSPAKGGPPAKGRGGGSGGGRAVPVTAGAAVTKAVPLELNTFGTVQAEATVAIKSQVTERLKQVHFKKGQQVGRGDLLFTIETKPFEVALAQAQAALARDQVQAANAKREAERQLELLNRKFASQAEYDKANADAEALAQTVKADEAAIQNVQLQLDYCQIRSPLDGRAGNLLVDEGNLVKANDIPLVVINQVSPIEVLFSIPQRDLAGVRRYLAGGDLTAEALLPDAPDQPETGRLTFVDNAVDKDTGTIQLGATFPNANERLWPGQYVRVKLILAAQQQVVTVPGRAVQTGADGKYVAVIKDDGTVAMRPVKVNRVYGADAVIDDGVQVGERVVTDGHLQLVNGSRVEVREPAAPTAPAAPAAPTGKKRKTP